MGFPLLMEDQSVSCVKADWNCLLQIFALSRASVVGIPLSVSIAFFKDLTNDQNLLIFSFLLGQWNPDYHLQR